MSSGPFVDRTEAEAKTKELERYLFDDGLAGALVEFLKTLTSMPADKHPPKPIEPLLKELGVAYQTNNIDAMVKLLKKARAELEQCVFENTKLRVRLNGLYTKLLEEDEKTNAKIKNWKSGCNGTIT
ncbi:hypothetical protein Aduo_007245 [Ancylostoma duodenale]